MGGRWGWICGLGLFCGCEASDSGSAARAGLVDDDGVACAPEAASHLRSGGAFNAPEVVLDVATAPEGGTAFVGRYYVEAAFGDTTLTTDVAAFEYGARVVGSIDDQGHVGWARKLADHELSTGLGGEIAVRPDGVLVVAGRFSQIATLDPVQVVAVPDPTPQSQALGDGYVFSLAPGGVTRWGTAVGVADRSDTMVALELDPLGRAIAVMASLAGPASAALIVALDDAGVITWQTSISGLQPVEASVRPDGEIVVVGTGRGPITLRDGTTVSPTGMVIAGVRVGESAPRWVIGSSWTALLPSDVAITSSGGIAVAGSFSGSATVGSTTLASAGGSDGFVATFDAARAFDWAWAFGGTGNDLAAAIDVDGDDLVVAGSFRNTITVGTDSLTSQGLGDGVAVYLDAEGQVRDAFAFGRGADAMSTTSLAVHEHHRVAVAGSVRGESEVGAALGSDDLFVSRYGCVPRIEGFSVAADALTLDRVGAGDAALAVDGVLDNAFDVTIRGPVAALTLLSVAPDGGPYGIWQYDTVVGGEPIAPELGGVWQTGAQTWVLGVYDREDGTRFNAGDGSLALGDGTHALRLFGTDVDIAGRGLAWQLVVERPDGSTERSAIVVDGAKVALGTPLLAPSADDRVAPGDAALVPDGTCDAAFDIDIDGRVRALAVLSTDAAGNPSGGQQWDTFVGDTPIPAALGTGFPYGAWTWTLGVWSWDWPTTDAEGTLVDAGDIWPRSLRLQVANADAVTPGGHYRVVAELFDGTLVHSDPVSIDVAPSCGVGCCTD